MWQKVRRGYVFANANSHQSGWGSLGMKTPPTSVVSMRVHRKSKLPAEALCFRIVLQPSPGVDCLRQINDYRDNVTIRIYVYALTIVLLLIFVGAIAPIEVFVL